MFLLQKFNCDLIKKHMLTILKSHPEVSIISPPPLHKLARLEIDYYMRDKTQLANCDVLDHL